MVSHFHERCYPVLHEHQEKFNDLNAALFINDAGDGWGTYIYQNPSDRPTDEKLWYELLTKNDEAIGDLVHFWQQFLSQLANCHGRSTEAEQVGE